MKKPASMRAIVETWDQKCMRYPFNELNVYQRTPSFKNSLLMGEPGGDFWSFVDASNLEPVPAEMQAQQQAPKK